MNHSPLRYSGMAHVNKGSRSYTTLPQMLKSAGEGDTPPHYPPLDPFSVSFSHLGTSIHQADRLAMGLDCLLLGLQMFYTT